MELNEILAELEKLGDPKAKKIKEGFAITANNSYGIFQKDLKILAKKIGKDDDLAIKLFNTGIYEARLLTRNLYNSKNLTEQLMEKWVITFENWEICDSFCMSFFSKSVFALPKVLEWTEYDGEYQKRAGFVLMVGLAFIDKHATNDVFRQFFLIMKQHANDERRYVMKGINWALRQVGKRNKDLYNEAIVVANEILAMESKPAKWIAKDALRQLQNPKIHFKNYPRKTYGKQ